ncbi:MAG: GlsB/YeaQ/YmgE family stress response membrane protein [Candidatus Omnitrophota bacterium]
MDFIWFILVGLIAGWLAGVLVKGSGFGIIGDIVVGIIGALIGGLIFRSMGMPWGGFLGAIIVATIGAIILIFILRLIRRI